MIVRALLFVGLLSTGLGACSANRNCLSGALAPHYAKRSDLRLLQREFQRAEAAPPAVRARIYEALPDLFPDLSDRADEPRCAPELVDALADELARRPPRFNNATLHELDALGRIEDTVDVMPEKARLLLRVAQLSDDAIGSYQRLAEERGPSPPPSQLRERALARLAQSNLFLNDGRVRRFLLDTALHSNDVREEGLVAFTVAEMFQGSPEAASAQPLLNRWLEQSRVRLSGSPDPNALELLLLQINYLGAYAGQYGLGHEARSLFERIVAVDGQLPVTRGLEGGARDLLVRAAQALEDNLDGPAPTNWLEPSLPFPARSAHSRSAWALDDSTIVEWSPDVTVHRLRELDQELANLHDPELRCWLLARRADWLPRSEHAALFSSLLLEEKTPSCALKVALGLETVPALVRARTTLAVLAETPQPGAFQRANERSQVARWALANHLSWLNEEPRLSEQLVEQALTEDAASLWEPKHEMDELDNAQRRFEFQAVLERSLRLLSASPAPETRARAQALGRHWLELARAGRIAEFSDIYTFELANAFVLSLATLGPRLGLEREVLELLTVPPEQDNRNLRLARLLFERARR